jgi:protein-tyrosine phosphatase
VTVALTLLAAGVDRDAVIADYARTETLLPEKRNREVVERIRAVHPEAVNIEQLATRSPAPVMQRLLDRLGERYGSPVGFLEAHGLADDEIAELRRVLVASS